MSDAPFHNQQQFEKAIERIIAHADKQNRGQDLDKVVDHLQKAPADVSRLASLLMLVDDDFRPDLKAHIDAYRRFCSQKGREASDEEVIDVMLGVYKRCRA